MSVQFCLAVSLQPDFHRVRSHHLHHHDDHHLVQALEDPTQLPCCAGQCSSSLFGRLFSDCICKITSFQWQYCLLVIMIIIMGTCVQSMIIIIIYFINRTNSNIKVSSLRWNNQSKTTATYKTIKAIHKSKNKTNKNNTINYLQAKAVKHINPNKHSIKYSLWTKPNQAYKL